VVRGWTSFDISMTLMSDIFTFSHLMIRLCCVPLTRDDGRWRIGTHNEILKVVAYACSWMIYAHGLELEGQNKKGCEGLLTGISNFLLPIFIILRGWS